MCNASQLQITEVFFICFLLVLVSWLGKCLYHKYIVLSIHSPLSLCRAYDLLESHISTNPVALNKLCLDGPYDNELWRLGSRPDKPDDIPDDVFSAFIVVRS